MPHHNVFTVRAFDNLNYNPSSTTAKDSFHETGISLFQFSTELNGGISQGALQLSTLKKKNWPNLPDYYTTIPAVVLKREDIATIPKLSNLLPMIGKIVPQFDESIAKEKA